MGRRGKLIARCWAGQHPVPQAFDVGMNVHRDKTSTLVLKLQPKKDGSLAHAFLMDTNTRKIVAANVARLRKAREMNQTELGSRAGVGQTTISSIENPEGKSPTLETLSAVGFAYGLPEWTLLVDESTSKTYALIAALSPAHRQQALHMLTAFTASIRDPS